MLPLPSFKTSLTPTARPRPPQLAYEPPEQCKNYWVKDDILPDAVAVRARCLANPCWNLGYPHRPEPWPGMRFPGVLKETELAHVEAWVRDVTGSSRLWVETAPGGARLDCNVAQLVGATESGPRPHTDRRDLCRFAAVIYLSPQAPPGTGTGFYRLRHPNGALDGNMCPSPHNNLVEALKVSKLPPNAWVEEMRVENVFNRIVLYKAALVHSASGYFGEALEDKRLTAAFFWMAESNGA